MIKLKAVLAGAAAIFLAGGVTIYQAIQQAAQIESYSIGECVNDFRDLSMDSNQRHFFVALETGYVLPKAVQWVETGMVLQTECSAGSCVIEPSPGSVCRYEYTYTLRPEVDGWRVADVRAHPRVALAWKVAAEADVHIKWFGSFQAAGAACLAHTTAAKCKTLFDVDRHRYVWDTDSDLTNGIQWVDMCINGGHTADGDVCTYNYPGLMVEFPDTVYNGSGAWETEAVHIWTDEEMAKL